MNYNLIEQIGKYNDIAIIPHNNPDVDAIISSVILKKVLHMNGIKSKIYLLSEPDAITKDILERNKLYKVDKWQNLKSYDKLILVDCFTLGKEIPNEVIACFDHHPTKQDINYPVYINGSYSSTSKLLYDLFIKESSLYKKNTLKELVRNVLFSIYIDTNSLKSSKFNKDDLSWIQEMILKYNFSEDTLIREGYCLNDLSLPIQDLIFNGVKQYTFPNKKKAYISYLATEDYQGELNTEIQKATLKILQEENIAYFWLMISDMKQDKTILLKNTVGNFEVEIINRLVSRSVDIYPRLEAINL